MPRFPTAQKRPDTIPSFLVTARRFYGEAFGPRRPADLAESMADWSELSEEERSFALAHLQYLNLVAQAGTQRMLARVGELLEDLVEYAEDAAFGDGADPEEEEHEDDLDEGGDDEWQESLEAFAPPTGPDEEDDDVIDATYADEEALKDDEDLEEVPDGWE